MSPSGRDERDVAGVAVRWRTTNTETSRAPSGPVPVRTQRTSRLEQDEEVPVPDIASDALDEPVRADNPTPSGSVDGRTRDVVRLRLPAVGAYLSVLRSATAGLAARLDFTLEEIEDLRIAVDEACAILLTDAAVDADLECEFELLPEEIRVSVTVPTVDGEQPVRDSFAWTVLAALAGSVDSRVDEENRVSIDLQKRRAAAGDV